MAEASRLDIFRKFLASTEIEKFTPPEPEPDLEDVIASAFGKALSRFSTPEGELRVADRTGVSPVV